MKQGIFSILTIVFCLFAEAQDFKFKYSRDFDRVVKASSDPSSKLNYQSLLDRFLADDTSMTNYQVLSLLIGFTQQADYDPEKIKYAESKLYSLNANSEFEQATIIEDDLLEKYPLTSVGLIEKAYTCARLEQLEDMDKYGKRFRKIMQAMIFSGNGKDPESAIFALSINDARNFVKKVLKAQVGLSGFMKTEDGHYVVAIEAIFEKDTEADIEEGDDKNIYVDRVFFNLTHAEAVNK